MKPTPASILCASASVAALMGASALFAQQPLKDPTKAQDAQPAKDTPPAKPEKDTVWNVEGEDTVHYDSTGLGSSRNVTAVSSDGQIVKADIWKWNEKKKTAEGTGNLSLTDPEVDATSERVDVLGHKSKKLLILTGNVHLLLKPKEKKDGQPMQPMPVNVQDGKAQAQPPKADGDGKSESKRTPVQVTCDKLEYEYAKDKKHGTLTGNLTAVQKLKDVTRTVTAEHAETFGNKEEIVLYPPVHGSDTKGRIFESKTETVTISTKDGDESIRGKRMTIRFPATDDEDTTPAKPPAKPAKNP